MAWSTYELTPKFKKEIRRTLPHLHTAPLSLLTHNYPLHTPKPPFFSPSVQTGRQKIKDDNEKGTAIYQSYSSSRDKREHTHTHTRTTHLALSCLHMQQHTEEETHNRSRPYYYYYFTTGCMDQSGRSIKNAEKRLLLR